MEQVGLSNFEAGTWFGVLLPAGTPRPIVDQLNKILNAVLTEKELRETLLSQGAIIRGGTPEQFNDFFVSEYQKSGNLVKLVGITSN